MVSLSNHEGVAKLLFPYIPSLLAVIIYAQNVAHVPLTGHHDVQIYARRRSVVMQHETNSTKIIARLQREGWENVGGTKHTKFRKAGHSAIMVPRHRNVTPGVAGSIARAAGWSK